MTDLMSAIKSLPIYAIIDETLKGLSADSLNSDDDDDSSIDHPASQGSRGDGDIVRAERPAHSIGRVRTRSIVCASEGCGASASEVTDVGAAEFVTMFLLSWPFEEKSATNNLRAYVEGALEMPLPPILQQEIAMLRHQLRQIKIMFLEY